MLDYAVLPDLLALTALVYVFWSILGRRAGDQLRAWLVGWICVLLHFAVQLFDNVSNVAVQNFVFTISMVALALAGAAFICAANVGPHAPRLRRAAAIGMAAILVYIGLVCWNVDHRSIYDATLGIFVLAVVAFMALGAEVPRRERVPVFVGGLVLVCFLGWLTYRRQQDYSLDAIFCFLYLMAGIQYWRRFRRASTGVVVAVSGLLAWSAVFPISALFEIFAPHTHIEDSVWNIPKYIVAIGVLLTLLEDQMGHAEHLALHDPLTGLPNRRLLDDRLANAIERSERNRTRAAVLLVDLDDFKPINDTHGHHIGDQVLRVLASRLQLQVRKADTIARAGGDEFIIVVSDMLQTHGANVLAKKLLDELNQPIPIRGGLDLRVSASIGIALYPDDGLTADILYAKADAAMYKQKRDSKNLAEQQSISALEPSASGPSPI